MRRRLSVSAPRMIVRSHLPWPLRWAILALVLGFSAAIAMWAFEFGQDIAGIDRRDKAELEQLRAEVAQMRAERDRTQAIVNTADSMLKTERAAQQQLTQQLKQLEAENLALKGDLGFFERLLPTSGADISIRALHAEAEGPGLLRYQMLVMQSGRVHAVFKGSYQLTLSGTLNDKSWTFVPPDGSKNLEMKQYLRVEGTVTHPAAAVIKTLQVKVLDERGGVKATVSTPIS